MISRELKRRKAQREKEARKAEKGPAPAAKKADAEAGAQKAKEDDLNPNVSSYYSYVAHTRGDMATSVCSELEDAILCADHGDEHADCSDSAGVSLYLTRALASVTP